MTWSNGELLKGYYTYYCWVNSVLYDFKYIPCDVKAKLFDSYCLDVYGSQLWNYSKHDVDMFFTAWRKSIRRLWKIPNTTHCNLQWWQKDSGHSAILSKKEQTRVKRPNKSRKTVNLYLKYNMYT